MQRLRALNLLIQFVVWSFVVAYVVGVAILPGTPRYRRTRHAERRQGKALFIVRPPNHAPTTKQQPHRRADAAPTRRPRTGMVVRTRAATQGFQLMMGASLLISFTGPKSPLFDMARAAGTSLTPPHPRTHACTCTCARLRAHECAARSPARMREAHRGQARRCGRPIFCRSSWQTSATTSSSARNSVPAQTSMARCTAAPCSARRCAAQ